MNNLGTIYKINNAKKLGNYLQRFELDLLKQILIDYKNDIRILILGCATGKEISFLLKNYFNNIFGVDIDENEIKNLNSKYSTGNYFFADIENLPNHINSKYDMIIGLQTFDYVKNYKFL